MPIMTDSKSAFWVGHREVDCWFIRGRGLEPPAASALQAPQQWAEPNAGSACGRCPLKAGLVRKATKSTPARPRGQGLETPGCGLS